MKTSIVQKYNGQDRLLQVLLCALWCDFMRNNDCDFFRRAVLIMVELDWFHGNVSREELILIASKLWNGHGEKKTC